MMHFGDRGLLRCFFFSQFYRGCGPVSTSLLGSISPLISNHTLRQTTCYPSDMHPWNGNRSTILLDGWEMEIDRQYVSTTRSGREQICYLVSQSVSQSSSREWNGMEAKKGHRTGTTVQYVHISISQLMAFVNKHLLLKKNCLTINRRQDIQQ